MLEAIRIRAVEQMLRGESAEVLSRAFGFNPKTLYRWKQRFEVFGWDGLKETKATGRPSALNAEQQDWLAKYCSSVTPTASELVKVIKRKFKVNISEMTARRLGDKFGVRVVKPDDVRVKSRIKPPLKRVGSKFRVAPWIISHFPRHRVYVELFCGSCAVLFAKKQSTIEIVNDADKRLINVFLQMRQHPAELAALLKVTPYAQEFSKMQAKHGTIEDASLFIATSAQGFIERKSNAWRLDARGEKATNPKKWVEWYKRVQPVAERLKHVQILSEDALNALQRVTDIDDALIYVDPPYSGLGHYYQQSVDYPKLVKALLACRGKIIVSGSPEDGEHFQGWYSRAFETRTRWKQDSVEMIYANFPLRKR